MYNSGHKSTFGTIMNEVEMASLSKELGDQQAELQGKRSMKLKQMMKGKKASGARSTS